MKTQKNVEQCLRITKILVENFDRLVGINFREESSFTSKNLFSPPKDDPIIYYLRQDILIVKGSALHCYSGTTGIDWNGPRHLCM